MLRIDVRFPSGLYQAQSVASFTQPEWPPHPVRLIAALIAAAHGGIPEDERAEARAVVALLCEADPPLIDAPRLGSADGEGEAADGVTRLARLRGASRWAPRNHELSELTRGVSPLNLGRGRAEIHKVGVAVGDLPIAFAWPDVTLARDELALLRRLAQDVSYLGTARSPALVSVEQDETPGRAAWSPAGSVRTDEPPTEVRVPSAQTIAALDRWHERRSRPLTRNGAPQSAPYVPPATIGRSVSYAHEDDVIASPEPQDPSHWGDIIIVAVDRKASSAIPKGPTIFALTRATRKALLATYGDPGSPQEAPAILRSRGADGHIAFLALSFVAPAGTRRADGHVLGVGLVFPHPDRVADVARQRLDVERGLRELCLGDGVREPTGVQVPGVGTVFLRPLDGTSRVALALTESRYRGPSRQWSTASPLVHSRYRARKGEAGVYDQVAAECRDVGLPPPAGIEVRRVSRFRGAPLRISGRGLPAGWDGPLRGPQGHVDLWFDEPIVGPVILGRGRHFGLGLCLPFDDEVGG